MLAIISPAKRLDFKTPAPTKKYSLPAFLDDSSELIDTLRERRPRDLVKLMGISDALAELNVERYRDWTTPFTPGNAKPAVHAFVGDVYLGLEAGTLTARDLNWAQNHLRILSGLHGILRPLDLIQPYRLEMGTRLATARGADLYAFWGERVTDALNEALAALPRPVLVNLASNEYAAVLDPGRIEARVVTPKFLESRNGRTMFVQFTAKRARGLMTRYMITRRVRTLKALQQFDLDGYRYCPERSEGDTWVFLRG